MMILFFPQYQAGTVPSRIPIGTPTLRKLWKNAPGFIEVPLQPIDPANKEMKDGVRYRVKIQKQLLDAQDILDREKPDFILTTGGDCGASYSAIAYTNEKYNGKIGVIWVDAHGDIHVPPDSPAGDYHGMVLRNLLGDDAYEIKPRLPLKMEQIGYLGLRDTEPPEDVVIAKWGIPRFDGLEVMAGNGPLDTILAHFKRNGLTHIYLHVDCDVLDGKVFPHVHLPEMDGLTVERLLEVLQYLRARMPLAGCCLTEWAPETPEAGIDVLKRIYTEGFGLELPPQS